MVYQASVYALAWSGTDHKDVPAILLYPCHDGSQPTDIVFHLNIAGTPQPRRILFRAVDWVQGGELLSDHTMTSKRRTMAQRWVDTH